MPKLRQWLGKTFIDETTTNWRSFIYAIREKEEKVGDYILRFETAESDLRCSGVELSQLNLAIHLLETINLSENQKRNIVSKVKFENNPNVFDETKDAVKLSLSECQFNPTCH